MIRPETWRRGEKKRILTQRRKGAKGFIFAARPLSVLAFADCGDAELWMRLRREYRILTPLRLCVRQSRRRRFPLPLRVSASPRELWGLGG